MSNDIFNFPSMIKRNARYRGPRESEKYLSSQQEQVYDIHQIYVEIDQKTTLQKSLVTSWFQGENEATGENITYSQEKSFETTENQSSYPLIPGMAKGSFSHIIVELNGIIEQDYAIENGYLILNNPISGSLMVSYVVTTTIQPSTVKGINPLHQQLKTIDERLGELERRRRRYEDARQ